MHGRKSTSWQDVPIVPPPGWTPPKSGSPPAGGPTRVGGGNDQHGESMEVFLIYDERLVGRSPTGASQSDCFVLTHEESPGRSPLRPEEVPSIRRG